MLLCDLSGESSFFIHTNTLFKQPPSFCLNKTSTKDTRLVDALNAGLRENSSMNIIPAAILVIEPHPFMREALCAALADEPGLKVALHAACVTQALQMTTRILPDIILIALDHPERGDLDELLTLHSSLPATPILALIDIEIPGQKQAILDHGAQAVLAKSSPRADLIKKLLELRPRHS